MSECFPKLRVGSIAPDFELSDHNGQRQQFYQYLQGHWGVLFFYPRDDSPLCTRQVCAFQDYHQEFENLGAVLLGISSDSSKSHERFKEKHRLSYPLWSDDAGLVQSRYGLRKVLGLFPPRVTLIIDPVHRVRWMHSVFLEGEGHMQKAFNALRALVKT